MVGGLAGQLRIWLGVSKGGTQLGEHAKSRQGRAMAGDLTGHWGGRPVAQEQAEFSQGGRRLRNWNKPQYWCWAAETVALERSWSTEKANSLGNH